MPSRSGEPVEEFRQDLMVRYLRAMASHAARAASEEGHVAGRADEGPRAAVPPPRTTAGPRVGQIMRPAADLPTVREDTGFLDVARVMARREVGAVPVIDAERRVVGVIAESDLLARAATLAGPEEEPGLFAKLFGRRQHGTVAEGGTALSLMSAPALTVHPWTTVTEAARAAARCRIRQTFVTDQHGRLVGVVSRNALLRALVRDDPAIREEIVSRVFEELAVDPARVTVHVRQGVVRLTGTLPGERIPPLTEAVARIADVDEVENRLVAS
ncbi:CBS domain-containing protein [Streptomyces sp. NPDC059696]|uniref:CBS domain-containing protein n=1 Tax=Streptomyces sp. NPDC059696 TaxID=3346911 RepID=UPI0036884A88